MKCSNIWVFFAVHPGQCRAEVLGHFVSLLLLSCAEQQRHRHSPPSVPCHLSCRRRVLTVGFGVGVFLWAPNKILFKKQESFLPGLFVLPRVGQKEQCPVQRRQEGAQWGFGVQHSSLSPQWGDMSQQMQLLWASRVSHPGDRCPVSLQPCAVVLQAQSWWECPQPWWQGSAPGRSLGLPAQCPRAPGNALHSSSVKWEVRRVLFWLVN